MNLDEFRFQPNTRVIKTDLDENESALMHGETKLTYALNQTGMKVWENLEKGLTIGEIVEKLREEFDVSGEQAKKGVTEVIQTMLSYNLIEVVGK